MTAHRSWLRLLLAGLLLVSGILFAIGVHAERSGQHEATATTTESSPEGHTESGESHTETSASSERSSERVLGIDVETGPTVALAVIASILLGAAVIPSTRYRAIVWAVMVFSLAAGVFDIAEVNHQVSRSDTALTVLAAVLAVMHLTAALVAFEVQREQVTHAG